MVEMVVALIILILLSGVCLTVYKPNVQKSKIVLYATMKNLTAANMAIIEGIENGRYHSANELNISGTYNADNNYCRYLTEALSVSSTGCNGSITLPGKIVISGLDNKWVKPATTADYEVKDVLVTIDGGSKFGVSKFPLRIYNGSGYTGMVHLIDCTNSTSAGKLNLDGTTKDVSTTAKSSYSTYCGKSINYLTSNIVASYDVYRADTDEEETTASLISSAVSPLEADCNAYGGQGVYNETQCKNAGYRLKIQCLTSDLCANANSAVLPNKTVDGTSVSITSSNCASYKNSLNPNDLSCFTLLHKPSAGTTFLLETMVGQFD